VYLAGGAGTTGAGGAGKLMSFSNPLVVLILCLAGADPLSALTGLIPRATASQKAAASSAPAAGGASADPLSGLLGMLPSSYILCKRLNMTQAV
jgi:hypothetical protein